MSNHVNWKGIFGSFLIGFLFLIGLASTAANAAPTCTLKNEGGQVSITIADTGMVASDGQSLPAGMTTYPGTGRTGDIAASCSDNAAVCQSAKWFLRFADSKFGWVSDNDLGSDPRAVACSYDATAMAQSCNYAIKDGMQMKNGGFSLRFSVKLPDGRVFAAYQPQNMRQCAGATIESDPKGNPHLTMPLAAANN